jgi:hypothetical protein
MEKAFIGIRDVDAEAFRKFRALAIRKKLKISEAFKEAVESWTEKEAKEKVPDIKNLGKMKPIKIGKKVRWSEEIDEILYGR